MGSTTIEMIMRSMKAVRYASESNATAMIGAAGMNETPGFEAISYFAFSARRGLPCISFRLFNQCLQVRNEVFPPECYSIIIEHQVGGGFPEFCDGQLLGKERVLHKRV